MRVKLVTFRYSATLGGFDDTALVDFTRDKEVITLREHFYLVNDTPHLTCVVTYQDAIVPRSKPRVKSRRERRRLRGRGQFARGRIQPAVQRQPICRGPSRPPCHGRAASLPFRRARILGP